MALSQTADIFPPAVKRAIRALQSPAYQKARSKNKLLPEVTDRASAENAFKLLPLSMLAIRVERLDPDNNPAHGQPGHQHGAAKGKKGAPWLVRIEQHQDTQDHLHYVWFYEGSQWMQKLYAVGALAAVIAVVLFPLWPYFMRRGVWYLSMGCLGLLGAFFGLAIVRLIFFLFSLVAIPPGIWIYPNLFEDVGFFDSFKPMWAWREVSLARWPPLGCRPLTAPTDKGIARGQEGGEEAEAPREEGETGGQSQRHGALACDAGAGRQVRCKRTGECGRGG